MRLNLTNDLAFCSLNINHANDSLSGSHTVPYKSASTEGDHFQPMRHCWLQHCDRWLSSCMYGHTQPLHSESYEWWGMMAKNNPNASVDMTTTALQLD